MANERVTKQQNIGGWLLRRTFFAFVFVAMFACGIGGYYLLSYQPSFESPEIVEADTSLTITFHANRGIWIDTPEHYTRSADNKTISTSVVRNNEFRGHSLLDSNWDRFLKYEPAEGIKFNALGFGSTELTDSFDWSVTMTNDRNRTYYVRWSDVVTVTYDAGPNGTWLGDGAPAPFIRIADNQIQTVLRWGDHYPALENNQQPGSNTHRFVEWRGGPGSGHEGKKIEFSGDDRSKVAAIHAHSLIAHMEAAREAREARSHKHNWRCGWGARCFIDKTINQFTDWIEELNSPWKDILKAFGEPAGWAMAAGGYMAYAMTWGGVEVAGWIWDEKTWDAEDAIKASTIHVLSSVGDMCTVVPLLASPFEMFMGWSDAESDSDDIVMRPGWVYTEDTPTSFDVVTEARLPFFFFAGGGSFVTSNLPGGYSPALIVEDGDDNTNPGLIAFYWKDHVVGGDAPTPSRDGYTFGGWRYTNNADFFGSQGENTPEPVFTDLEE